MILIISGTDRANSNSLKISNYVQSLFQRHGAEAEVLDLAELKPTSHGGPHYGVVAPEKLDIAIKKVNSADALYICVPEYNGSMPGALKFFIDHWKYPESFEFRPVAFCGLGGIWGGLRPVEHLQGVMGYRNAFMYPERIFLQNVFVHLKTSPAPTDAVLVGLFEKQISGFIAFVKALQSAGLDANSRLKAAGK